MLAASLPERLSVAVAGADPCELAARLPAVLTRWLPGIRVTDVDPDLFVEVVGEANELQVVLQNKTGEVVLRRSAPRSPDACPAEADGVALIVDRYLRDLGWEPAAAEVPIEPPPIVETATRAETATIATPPSEPIDTSLAIIVFGGGELLDRAPRFGIAPGIALRFGVGDHWELIGEGSGILPSGQDVLFNGTKRGRIETWTLRFLLGLGWCTALGPGRICGGARGGVERVQATIDESFLFQGQNVSTLLAVAGLSTHYDFAGLDPFGLSFEALFLGRAPLRTFFIEDADPDTRDYTVPQASGALRLAGWVRFF